MNCPNCKSSYSLICLKCGYDPKTNESKLTPEDLGMNELPHQPMDESHVWLGKFLSEALLEEYFEECIEDNDVTPINSFAKEQGEMFYDHDWVEVSFDASCSLLPLIEGHSYSDKYIDKVIEFAEKNDIKNFNVLIVADADGFKKPKSVQSQEVSL